MDISRWVTRWADFLPAKTAVHFEGRDITYAEMADRITALARMLKHELGVRPGDRVAHLGTNSPEMLELLFACARLGAMLVPLNWRLAAPELHFILSHSGARAVLVDPEFVATIDDVRQHLPDLDCIGDGGAGWRNYHVLIAAGQGDDANPGVDLDTPLMLVYTSGTTGRPKGAVLTQGALQWNAINATHAHDMTSADHILTNLPMFHVGGMNVQTTPAIHCGATVTMHRRFDPDLTIRDLQVRRPTLTIMVPAVIQALIGHPDWATADLGSLRLVMTGSSTVPEALIRSLAAKGLTVGQIYGSTETAPVAIYLRAEDAGRVGSTGKPATFCDIRVVDDRDHDLGPNQPGEILVRGPNILREYWGDAEATAEAIRDGWFHTGDIGYRDADGFYFVNDRKKDMIISGGENIYPAELENVLADCPAIAEAAVVGRPDPRWGEVAVAVVVVKAGGRLEASDVVELYAGRLARFKHPREVVFVDALPRNVMGKVLKYELRAELAAI